MGSKADRRGRRRNWVAAWRAGLATSIAFALNCGAASAGGDPAEAAFIARYNCLVVETLGIIHATPRRGEDPQDRYLILDNPRPRPGYVQCVFEDTDDRLLCEAASGFYSRKPNAPRARYVSPRGLAALERLGFSTDDSRGNFKQERDVAGPQDYSAIADMMLAALYEGYGGGGHQRITLNAPLVDAAKVELRCVPVS